MNVFRPAGKPLPTFTEYLRFLTKRGAGDFGLRVHTIATVVSLSTAFPLIMTALLPEHSVLTGTHSLSVGGLVSLVEGVCLLGAIWGVTRAVMKQHRIKISRDPRAQMHEEAVALARQMMVSKRLHKDLDGSSAQLLEESARFWREIKAELDTPFWRNPELPAHWKNVRLQTSSAADAAMEEMLVLLRSSFHPADHHGWEVVVEDAIETFVTGPKLRKGDRIPPGFAEARQIADKLKTAAFQVRTAATEIAAETGTTPLLSSGAALDLAIGDMRSLQEAEQELRRNLTLNPLPLTRKTNPTQHQPPKSYLNHQPGKR